MSLFEETKFIRILDMEIWHDLKTMEDHSESGCGMFFNEARLFLADISATKQLPFCQKCVKCAKVFAQDKTENLNPGNANDANH